MKSLMASIGVRTFIEHQLHLLWDHTPTYPRHPSTRDVHVAVIQQHLGYRFPTGEDKQALETRLRTQGAPDAPTEEALRECAYTRLRAVGIALPASREVQRLVQAALQGFFQDVDDRVVVRLSMPVRTALDALLVVGPEETHSLFDRLKAEPAAPGVQALQQEVATLQALRAVALPGDALTDVPLKVV